MSLRWVGWAPVVDRLCRHNVGHPDPDSVAWLERAGYGDLRDHACDGCCLPPSRTNR
jgi:hypothetical protein